jgi:hypothetical protein
MFIFRCLTFLFVLISVFVFADMKEDLLKGVLVEGITVDLREPEICNGVLTTCKGGVIKGPSGIRIQATKITYTRKVDGEEPVCTLIAEENLMVEFGRYVLVGDRLEYDFQNQAGRLFNGKTGLEHWFIGGDVIELKCDGSYFVENSYITTTETFDTDWDLSAHEVWVKDSVVRAKNLKFHLMQMTLFWLPSFKMDLAKVGESPISYRAGWGGKQGPRVGFSYEALTLNRMKAYLRFDYRLRRGPGGGIETEYHSPDRKESFETISYIARDNSIFIPSERVRYRFQGAYSNLLMDDKLSIDFTYDKLSDKYMATDYADAGLEIEESGRTELNVRRQEENWIANFIARPRVNSFETVKQELPTFETDFRPFQLGHTGIISDNQFQASYLDFAYAKHVHDNVHDFNSTRVEFAHKLYRPFNVGVGTVMPHAGAVEIFYGNSPQKEDRWLVIGDFGCDFNSPFYKIFNNKKHVITPYVNYEYLTFPTASPHQHYIFDIEDGWYHLNTLCFGVDQSLFSRNLCGDYGRLFYIDLYTYAFFKTPTIPATIPKVYGQMIFNTFPTLRHTIDTGWNCFKHQIDYFNFLSEWTVSEDFAIAVEYRHRDAYFWRKIDRENFILDSFRSVRELRHSSVSDQRDTALLRFFYRFLPNWAVQYESRHGWHRHNHTRYNEFELDLIARLRSATRIKFSYQHLEAEDRVAIYFSLDLQKPDHLRPIDCIPLLNF